MDASFSLMSQRKHSRFVIANQEVTGLMTDNSDDKRQAFILWDISENGVGVLTGSRVNTSSKVSVILGTSAMEFEVQWCRPRTNGTGYHCGLKLKEDHHNPSLQRLIKAL